MKRLALIPILATFVVAAHAQSFVDNARVTNVEPQYDSVRVPRQECGNQWVEEPRRGGGYGGRESRDGRDGRDYGGAVLGGIVGGLIGNQVGGGHGREAATAVGAVVGAFTGNNIANRDRWQQPAPVARQVTVCRDVEDVQSRLVGYQVTYIYNGQQYTTLMQEKPGRYVPVRVSVDPVGR